jgi:hypothetical protein
MISNIKKMIKILKIKMREVYTIIIIGNNKKKKIKKIIFLL